MARRTQPIARKRSISTRIQLIIEDRYGTLYAFELAMKAQAKTALASTVRGWVPPQRRWKAKPNGRAVRQLDWDAVRIPDGSSLIEFCDLCSVRADHILFGHGEASRGQSRGLHQLASDVAAHISESLRANGYLVWSPAEIDGDRALADIVAAATAEAKHWMEVATSAPARLVASQGLFRERIQQLGIHLQDTEGARSLHRKLLKFGVLLENQVNSDQSQDEARKMRYLKFPPLDPSGFSLPLALTISRVEAEVRDFVAHRQEAEATDGRAKSSANRGKTKRVTRRKPS